MDEMDWLGTTDGQENGDSWEHPLDRLGVSSPAPEEDLSWLNQPVRTVRTTPSADQTDVTGHLAPNGVESGQLISTAQRSPAWHEARRGKITASIAAACLGLHPYCSRAKAYRLITGKDVQEENEHMRRGTDGEAHALRLYAARRGVQVDPVGFVPHPQLQWLGASPDGLVGPMGLVEVKRPVKLPETVPPHHLIQMAVQMACTGRWWADYFALDNAGHWFERRVVRDPMSEYLMLMELWRFFTEFVEKGIEPPRKMRLTDQPMFEVKPHAPT